MLGRREGVSVANIPGPGRGRGCRREPWTQTHRALYEGRRAMRAAEEAIGVFG
jgi:hypothetical protein